jgi:hypothetical protein
VYDASGYSRDRDARQACLRHLVVDLAAARAHRLVMEQDDSILTTDQAVLFQAVRETGATDRLSYEHLPPRSEPLLWVADAAGWCWTHGPHWRGRITAAITHVTTV